MNATMIRSFTLQINGANFASDDVNHLLTDSLDLGMLSVASLALRLGFLLGETNAKHPEQVAIRCLDLNTGFNQRLPFLDHGAELVCGHVHAMEVGQQVATLQEENIINKFCWFWASAINKQTLHLQILSCNISNKLK